MTDHLYQVVGQQTLRIAELESEVSRLKAQLVANSLARETIATISDDAAVISKARLATYEQLTEDYEKLLDRHSGCEVRIAKLNRRYAQAREKVHEWHSYISHQALKKKVSLSGEPAVGQKPSPKQPSLEPFESSDQQKHDGQITHNLPRTPLSEIRNGTGAASDDKVSLMHQLGISEQRPAGFASTEQAHKFTSSQSTVVEPDVENIPPEGLVDEHNKENTYDDDDTVTFINERSKRRRIEKPRSVRIKQEFDTAIAPVQLSSDGQVQAKRRPRALRSGEMSDLDTMALPEVRGRPVTPQHKQALRRLPVTSLRLQDFKANPNFDGARLKSAEKPAGKNHRRCPPNCRRRECCGHKLQRISDLTAAQHDAKTDEEALQHFFGADWRLHMAFRSPDDQKEITVLAHEHMANSSRTSHLSSRPDRAKSPPGFWRMDMPDTQELKADQKAAEEAEQRMIEERWHEALRANGKWLFRDET